MRYASFRFDDGFLAGAQKAHALLYPDCGSFFIVSGLIDGTIDTEIEFFKGRDFGSSQDWVDLVAHGHDVQPHGMTHQNLTTLEPKEQIYEASQSLALVREIHAGPYIFCHPYNGSVDLDFAALGYSAAGFRTSRFPDPLIHNELREMDVFRLKSSAIFEDNFDWLVSELSKIPDETWTVFALHSLDEEGFRPWSSEKFGRLVDSVRHHGLDIQTVRDMVRRFGHTKNVVG